MRRSLNPLAVLAALLLSGLAPVTLTAWQSGPAIDGWQWRRAEAGLPGEVIVPGAAVYADNSNPTPIPAATVDSPLELVGHLGGSISAIAGQVDTLYLGLAAARPGC